jgi:hypothetical protein
MNFDQMAALLSLEARQGCGNSIEHAFDIYIDDLFPFVDFVGLQRRKRHQPGVVDKHIESAVILDSRFRERFDLFALGHVHGQGECSASSGCNLTDNLVQAALARCTGRDLCPPCREMAGDCFANATAGSCNGDSLVLDV